MILILNDNLRSLESWELKMQEYEPKLYEYPQNLMKDILEKPHVFKEIKYYVLDRYFFGKNDILKDGYIKELKKNCPNPKAKFILSSASCEIGDKIKGFDLVLSRDSVSMEELKRLLGEI